MDKGSFEDFLGSLRAFESGVDFERFQQGIITEGQTRGWVGDDNWNAYQNGSLTWTELQYKSENFLGFVGYQFGEALLIDLGYYRDDFYYGNGAAKNTWGGQFTGKNGINSLDDLKTDVQELVIRDAFTSNFNVIENGLNAQGRSLDDLVGRTVTYEDTNGGTVEVELSLTGIMAASHLRGAFGTLQLLTGGGASADENGTSILQYIEQFGGYDAPALDDILAGNFPTGTGGGPVAPAPEPALDPEPEPEPDPGPALEPSQPTPDPGDPGTGGGSDYQLGWQWGTTTEIAFEAGEDRLEFGWLGASDIAMSEVDEGIRIEIVGNNQSYLITGADVGDFSDGDLVVNDASARTEINDFFF